MRITIGMVLMVACVIGAGCLIYSDLHSQANAGTTTPQSGQPSPESGFGGAAQGRGQRMMQRLTTELNLSPDQVSQIKPILKDAREKMMSIRNDSTLTDDQARAQMQQLREQTNQLIKPILTPDQIAKWKVMRARMAYRQGGDGQSPQQGQQ